MRTVVPSRLPAPVIAGFLALTLTMPASLSAQTPATHTVRKGDTLWDIAAQYFNDPLQWPRIYQMNTDVVEDPHWIYPGEVLRLVGGPEVSAVPAQDTPVPAPVVAQQPAMPQPAVPQAAVAQDTTMIMPDTMMAMGDTMPDTTVLAVVEQAQRDTTPADLTPLFGTPRDKNIQAQLQAYSEQPYRPLRRDEFYSAGFLTENQKLPYGTVLGPVEPSQIGTTSGTASITTYSKVAVRPPPGGAYQVGDSLLVVRIDRKIDNYGDVLVPTGMVRVTDVSRPENTAVVVAVYGPMRDRQLILPLERFADPGRVRPVPISDGVAGHMIESRDLQVLKGPQDVVFLDKGRLDGVAPGDLFEVRQESYMQETGVATIPESMGLIQVVRVGDHTATGRFLKVLQPDIRPGIPVKQVAKLPS